MGKYRLKTRIMLTFCGYGLILSLAFGLLTIEAFKHIEDVMLNDQIRLRMKAFLEASGEMPYGSIIPVSPLITAYAGDAALPDAIRPWVVNLPDGVYEVGEQRFEVLEPDFDMHAGIVTLPDQKERIYFIYQVKDLEVTDRETPRMMRIFFGAGCLFILVGLGCGYVTARRLTDPVLRLSSLVTDLKPNQIPSGFSRAYPRDEVGVLARALDKGMDRIRAFIEREQAFTRDASHELRTPLTVMRGALEILNRRVDVTDPRINGLLQRMDRSLVDMERTVDLFLWLAREDAALTTAVPVNIREVVDQAIDRNRHLLAARPVEVIVIDPPDADRELTLHASPEVLGIVIGNLVQNAFRYTLSGEVSMVCSRARFEIRDTGPGMTPELQSRVFNPFERGHSDIDGCGLGLSIVKRLCDRLGWPLEIESREGEGTRIILSFPSDAGKPFSKKN